MRCKERARGEKDEGRACSGKLALHPLMILFLIKGRTKRMQNESRREDLSFKVECSWCGRVIRRNNTKDSHGMCLKCYARMLGEHGHSHEFDNSLRWARSNGSER